MAATAAWRRFDAPIEVAPIWKEGLDETETSQRETQRRWWRLRADAEMRRTRIGQPGRIRTSARGSSKTPAGKIAKRVQGEKSRLGGVWFDEKVSSGKGGRGNCIIPEQRRPDSQILLDKI